MTTFHKVNSYMREDEEVNPSEMVRFTMTIRQTDKGTNIVATLMSQANQKSKRVFKQTNQVRLASVIICTHDQSLVGAITPTFLLFSN